MLREAVAAGVNHIDTSDFYGPHVTNQLIREALHPYPDGLTIVTKVGTVRGADASWNPAQSPAELTKAVHNNPRNLDVDVLDVVNLRVMGDVHAPSVGGAQVEEARDAIAPVVCVQNLFNLAHREDDALVDKLAGKGTCRSSARRFSRPRFECGGGGRRSWLLSRSPNILLIPGTSSPDHLRENLALAELKLPDEMLAELSRIGGAASPGRLALQCRQCCEWPMRLD